MPNGRPRSVAAKAELAKEHDDVDGLVDEKLETERKRLSEEALSQARELVTVELQDKDQQLTKCGHEVEGGSKAQSLPPQGTPQLEEQKQALELKKTVDRRLDEERNKIRGPPRKQPTSVVQGRRKGQAHQ